MGFEEYIALIKQKKELSGIDDSIVNLALSELNKKQPFPENLSDKGKKLIVKQIRSQLRRYVGRFSVSQKERIALLEKGDIEKLLETHSSTKERLPYYSELIEIIKACNPSSILDLGCGLNPIALAGLTKTYYASDINKEDLEIVKKFFEINNIQGKAFVYDMRNINDSLPEADLGLLLKLFDVIENNGHKLAEKIIKSLRCKILLVSFSTKTLSGRPMNHPQRGWVERLLSRLAFKFETYKIKNEIFYLIHKS